MYIAGHRAAAGCSRSCNGR